MIKYTNIFQEIPAESGPFDVNIDQRDELPDSGLPDVVEIIIAVDDDANISDLELLVCNEPGNVHGFFNSIKVSFYSFHIHLYN